MRKLLFELLGLSLFWAGYWIVGERALERSFATWLSNQQGPVKINYSSLSTTGFPNRFDTTFNDVNLVNNRPAVSWKAPFFQVLALSYQPNKIVAIWPNQQTLTLGAETYRIRSDRMRGSALFKANTTLALNKLSLVTENLGISARTGEHLKVASFQVHTRQNADQALAYDLAISLGDILPTNVMTRRIDPMGKQPKRIDGFWAETTLKFDAAWDRHMLERRPPRLLAVRVDRFQLLWGEIDMNFVGNVTVGRDGNLSGRLDLSAKRWQLLLALAVDAGLIDPNISQTVTNALTILSQASGDPNILETPLIFENGRMSLGPFPLGPSPRIQY